MSKKTARTPRPELQLSASQEEAARVLEAGAALFVITWALVTSALPNGIHIGFRVLGALLLVAIGSQVIVTPIFAANIQDLSANARALLTPYLTFIFISSRVILYVALAVVSVLAPINFAATSFGERIGFDALYRSPYLIFGFPIWTNWIARKVAQSGTSYAKRVGTVILAGGAGVALLSWLLTGDMKETSFFTIYGVAALTVVNHALTRRPREGLSKSGVRGRALVSGEQAAEQIQARFGKSYTRGVSWGGVRLPDEASTVHFYITGSPGSGKSLSLRLLISEAVLDATDKPNRRLLIYDPKREFLPLIVGAAGENIAAIMNPFDRRSHPWNLADDFHDDASADQLAHILIPESTHGERYWTTAPRAILASLIKALNQTAPGAWRLRDILLLLRSPALLKSHLEARPDLAHVTELHLSNERTAHSLLSQLHADLEPFEVVAALWDHQERRGVSSTTVRDFATCSNGIVVFSNDPKYSASLAPFYRLYIARISEMIRSHKSEGDRVVGADQNPARTWLIIDEAPSVGRLPGLKELMAEGRSFGACVALGFQDIHDLYSVYGKEETHAMLGQCGNKAVLRLENAETATAMAKQFSAREVIQTSRSENKEGTTVSSAFAEEQLVLPKQIMDLPRPVPGPLIGFYSSTFTDPYVGGHAAEALLASEMLEDKRVAAYAPHQDFEAIQRLRAFDEKDFVRLKIAGPPTKAEEPAKLVAPPTEPSSAPPTTAETPRRRGGLFSAIE